MATFAGLTVFYILWSIYLLIQTEPCFFLKNIVEMTKMIGFVRYHFDNVLIGVVEEQYITCDYQTKQGGLKEIGWHAFW